MTTKTVPKFTPCKNCGATIHYGGDLKGWVHADETMWCHPGDYRSTADPGTWCRNCGEFCGETSQTPWGINTDCRRCGYHSYFSIGD